MKGAFHGYTFAAASAGAILHAQEGFESFLKQFIHAPFNDMGALQKIIDSNTNVVAIMLEPIEGD